MQEFLDSEEDVTRGQKTRRGAPVGNKNAETHGYYRRKVKLEPVSFKDLNFSSSGGEQLRKRFIELLNHCGGERLVSAVRRRIIERIVFTEYQLDCLDLYLVKLGPRIVNRRKRTLIPIVRERDALVSTLTKLYEQIGLDPRKPPVPTLAEYMATTAKVQRDQ
jgi:hypothetical protein